ncbi:MAG: MotA/TolQ/ExbB proton channel family protein [Gemmatimonadaceae bacterium]
MRTILTWYQSGGPFIVPLLLAGAAGMLVLARRIMWVSRRSEVNARPFMERVIALARAGKTDEALALCVEHEAALPDMGLVLLRCGSRDTSELRDVARAARLTTVPELKQHSDWLPALVHIVLLLGAVGAVANLHDALQATTGSGRAPATMASAIVHALRPLGASILVAIPLVAGNAYLRSAAGRIHDQLEEFAERLVNALSDLPDVRLGHRAGTDAG